MFKKIKFATRERFEHLHKAKKNMKELKKLTMCKKCYAFYYQKIWHFEAPVAIQNIEEKEIPVKFAQCPACIELEVSLYEKDSERDLVNVSELTLQESY